jgi:hypothetical protein
MILVRSLARLMPFFHEHLKVKAFKHQDLLGIEVEDLQLEDIYLPLAKY